MYVWRLLLTLLTQLSLSDEDNGLVRVWLGRALFELGEARKAVEVLEEAAEKVEVSNK